LGMLTNRGSVIAASGRLVIWNASPSVPLVETGRFHHAPETSHLRTDVSYTDPAPASIVGAGTLRVQNSLRLEVDLTLLGLDLPRSEERRVGKECRCRGVAGLCERVVGSVWVGV